MKELKKKYTTPLQFLKQVSLGILNRLKEK